MNIAEIIFLIFSYIIGSIPFGVVVAKLSGLGDLTRQGSGNIGATNVLRVGGKKLGIITLVLDALKGVVAVIIARKFFGYELALQAGFIAVLGHIFPVWLKFKGGKGVATSLAVMAALNWMVGVFACASWLVVFTIKRISSLSSIAAMVAAALFAYSSTSEHYWKFQLLLSFLVISRHYANIIRLVKGEEKKLGKGK